MQKTNYTRAGALFALFAVIGAGCHNAPPVTPPPTVQVPVKPTEPTAPPETTAKTPIKDALEALLADDAFTRHLFPKGTRLNSVRLKDEVASLDFSSEFAALANSGETAESQAQKALRATLTAFPTVKKMRVTVDGKPFDSQATDWNTPFPVRESAREGDRSADSGGATHP